jgi:glycerol-3-phosphate cytidylyltransferase
MKGYVVSKMIIGYILGIFDLFHIGHLNIIKKSKQQCDYLIVGVLKDDFIVYKDRKTVIEFNERIEIVRSIKYVDKAVPLEDMDKVEAWKKYKFNKMFVGDDWKNTKRWIEVEKQFHDLNVEIIYFPYTKSTSSTLINQTLINQRDK